MSYRRVLEKDYHRVLYAVYAEEKNNDIKINACLEVSELVSSGAKVFKVESEGGVFQGVQVMKDDEVLFSKFRK